MAKRRKFSVRPNHDKFRASTEIDSEEGLKLCDQILELIEEAAEGEFKNRSLLGKAEDYAKRSRTDLINGAEFTQKWKDGLMVWVDAISKGIRTGR